jgi:uncharacterized protein (TIGR02117 family)
LGRSKGPAGRILRIAGRILAGLAAAAVLYAAATAIGGLIQVNIPPKDTPFSPDQQVQIFFLNNRYHVEICLPASLCPFRDEIFEVRGDVGPEGGYYCFGWGDRVFYPVTPFLEDLNPELVFRALFLPTSAAIRISFYDGPIRGDIVTPYRADRQTVERLYGFIDSYLNRGSSGELQVIPPETVNPVYGDSLFLEASGTYSLLFTCNNWSSRALRQAGIQTGIWTPLAWRVAPGGGSE